jgi:hypothetical protein
VFFFQQRDDAMMTADSTKPSIEGFAIAPNCNDDDSHSEERDRPKFRQNIRQLVSLIPLEHLSRIHSNGSGAIPVAGESRQRQSRRPEKNRHRSHPHGRYTASRHGVEFTNGDEPDVKIRKAKGKRK